MELDDYGLTETHKLFCEYYIQNNNAGLSYKRAFDPKGERLKESSAYTSGSRLLKKDNIKKYLNKLRSEIRTDKLMSAEDILYTLNEMAVNPNLNPNQRLKALELLGKHQMLFSEKLVMDSQVEINLVGIDDDQERITIDHDEPEQIEYYDE